MLRWIGMGVAESRSDMVPATGFEPVRFYSLEPESSASANSATRAIFNTIHWNLIAVWIYACDSVCDSGGALKSSQRRAIELLQIQVHFDTHTRSFGTSASTQFPASFSGSHASVVSRSKPRTSVLMVCQLRLHPGQTPRKACR